MTEQPRPIAEQVSGTLDNMLPNLSNEALLRLLQTYNNLAQQAQDDLIGYNKQAQKIEEEIQARLDK